MGWSVAFYIDVDGFDESGTKLRQTGGRMIVERQLPGVEQLP